MSRAIGICAALVCALSATSGNAALVIAIDTDGVSVHTPNPNAATLNPLFRFGGNTTNHGGLSTRSTAAGLPNGNSIFGGNGSPRDIYEYLYTPGVNVDNTVFAPGTALGNGNTATGLTGGVRGIYAAYATWPRSENVDGVAGGTGTRAPTTFELLGPGNVVLATTQVNQNTDIGVAGNTWFRIGTATLDPGIQYVLRQTAPNSTFVSTRAAGAMFELITPTPAAVPEPSSMLLLGLVGVGGLAARRFRRKSAA